MTNPSWYSTAVGFSALKSSSFGISNTAVGSFALTSNTEGSSNTAMGDSALAKNTTGEGNIALGYQALKSNATGSNNIAIGKHTLTGSNDVGFYNIAIGDAVMQNALNTQNNVVIGHFAGQSIRAANSLGGSGNTGIGGWNFRELRFGSNNVALGYYAGDSLSTGSNNIAIGAYQKLPDSANELNNPNHSNRMNIGGLLFGKNMTGNFGNPAGQLGIGLTDPTARLEVAGSIKASDTLTANRIIRRGGTGSQVLLADGSVAVAGTGVALSSGIISSDTSVYERFVWLTKNQRIVGIKTFADTVKLQKDLWVNGISVGSGGGINSIIMGANQTGGLGNNRMNLGGLLFGTDMTGTYGSPAGNIGIGLTNPSKRLEVAGSIKASDTLFVNLIGVNHSQPLERIDVIGNIKASGALIASSNNISSDSRLKSNIEPITNALSIINQMRPVKYDKKSDLSASTYDYHEFGFLAQEMKAILPLLVSEGKDPNKLLSLNYTALIPVLTKALQEQQVIIEELIKRVEKLEKR
jgi:hypothetical protein